MSAERAKTDDSLADGRTLSEHLANAAVVSSRAEADEAKSHTRLEVDDSSEAERAAPGGTRQDERLNADERLRQDRQAADDALDSERRQMDVVLEDERQRCTEVVQEHFQAERKKTDRDLTHERAQADAVVERASAVFTEEKDAHGVTKGALVTRDEFLSIVSHDLRSPLGSIAMAAELLTGSPLYAAADDEERECLEMIGRNAAQALRMISDLLDMERIAAGNLGIEVVPQDVGDILRDAAKALQSQASAKKLTLRVRTPETGVVVPCDRDRVTQLLSNLIGNALKFTPAGGAITLTARAADGEVGLSVADTGPGIPEGMRDKLFDRFSQVGKRDRNGLGLGLYIAKMIVKAHGGRIWLESAVGQGCTFHVMLPAGLPH